MINKPQNLTTSLKNLLMILLLLCCAQGIKAARLEQNAALPINSDCAGNLDEVNAGRVCTVELNVAYPERISTFDDVDGFKIENVPVGSGVVYTIGNTDTDCAMATTASRLEDGFTQRNPSLYHAYDTTRDSGSGYNCLFAFDNRTAGKTYYIGVIGEQNATGNYSLFVSYNLATTGPAGADCAGTLSEVNAGRVCTVALNVAYPERISTAGEADGFKIENVPVGSGVVYTTGNTNTNCAMATTPSNLINGFILQIPSLYHAYDTTGNSGSGNNCLFTFDNRIAGATYYIGVIGELSATGNYSLFVNYPALVQLTVRSNNGSISTNGINCTIRNNCSQIYEKNTALQLTATANPGYTFSEWTGDCLGTSNPLSIVMNADKSCSASFSLILPTTPTFPSASVQNNSQINLSWSNVGGASYYRLYRAHSLDGFYEEIYTGNNRSYSDTILFANVTYYYKLRACINSISNTCSAYSPNSVATTHPNAPLAPIATVYSASQINLSWSNSSGAGYYRLYRANSLDGSYEGIYASNSRSYSDTELTANATYYYKLKACTNSISNTCSAYSPNSVATTHLNPPLAPIATVYSASKINLSWSNVSGASYYRLYRANSLNGFYREIDISNNMNYSDTRLVANSTYYYKLKACNNDDSTCSAYSRVQTAVAVSFMLDVENNGETSNKDAAIIVRYLFGSRGVAIKDSQDTTTIVEYASSTIQSGVVNKYLDIDKNEEVNTKDGTLLLRYLLHKQGSSTSEISDTELITGIADENKAAAIKAKIRQLLSGVNN